MTAWAEAFVRGVTAHLGQSALVLLALLLLARALRWAPARTADRLWWVAFAKLLLPLPLLGPVGAWLLPEGAAIALGEVPAAVLDPLGSARTQGGAALSWAAPALAMWSVCTAALLVRFIRRAARARSRVGIPLAAAPDALAMRLEAALRGTPVCREGLVLCADRGMPAVSGWLRPRIYLPRAVAETLEPEELRAVLLHEEEHRRRRDPARAALRALAGAVLFFYPPVWLLLSRLRRSAELCCDEAVLRAGVDPRTYARALARTVRMGLFPAHSPAAADPIRLSSLQERLERLTQSRRFRTMPRHRMVLAAALAVVALTSFLPFQTQAGDAGKGEVVQPRLIKESAVQPVYPPEEKAGGTEGKVILVAAIGADGAVGSLRPVQEIEGHPAFTRAAKEAVAQWRFEPATQDGKPVSALFTLTIMFRVS